VLTSVGRLRSGSRVLVMPGRHGADLRDLLDTASSQSSGEALLRRARTPLCYCCYFGGVGLDGRGAGVGDCDGGSFIPERAAPTVGRSGEPTVRMGADEIRRLGRGGGGRLAVGATFCRWKVESFCIWKVTVYRLARCLIPSRSLFLINVDTVRKSISIFSEKKGVHEV
jgi:hypothetical protein